VELETMTDLAANEIFGNPLLASLDRIVQERAPEWKLVQAGYSASSSVYSEWSDGKDKAVIQLARMASGEEASSHLQMFAWHIPLTPSHVADIQRDPVHFRLPQPVMPDARLPNLGDENHVWSKYDERGSSLIKLRRGSLIVQVAASSFGVAEKFARLVDEPIDAA
jgi:hypothetical protein